MPLGRSPGIITFHLVFSLHPIARTIALALILCNPFLFTAVISRFLSNCKTIVSFIMSMPCLSAISIYISAYSGPVIEVPVSSTPKPSGIHWGRIPPSQLFLSMTKTLLAPCSCADTAAARPAGPPPITATSTI